jgi:hypothetical protein
MQLVFHALEKTSGNANGDALMVAMKGMKCESPRGPITIDQRRGTTFRTIRPQGRKGERRKVQCRVCDCRGEGEGSPAWRHEVIRDRSADHLF